jgi:predicted neutral ceramidase superfamily lipid hydrolase
MGICLSFGYFTVSSSLDSSSATYAENFAEQGTESDEKSSENFKQLYLHETKLELPLNLYVSISKDIFPVEFILPTFWPAPSTPPPNLS